MMMLMMTLKLLEPVQLPEKDWNQCFRWPPSSAGCFDQSLSTQIFQDGRRILQPVRLLAAVQ